MTNKFLVNIAQDPQDPKVRWLQTSHDGHSFRLIEFRSDEEALQIISALQQSTQRTAIKHCDFCGIDTFDDEFGRCSICRNRRR